MPIVKLEDVDELYSILLDLEVFVYLQGLLQYDTDGTSVFEHSFEFAYKHAQNFLWEKQLEAVERLSSLLCKDGFCTPLKESL